MVHSLFRKWVMRQYWRMQQSQAVVGLLLWGTTITSCLALFALEIRGIVLNTFCFNDTIISQQPTSVCYQSS